MGKRNRERIARIEAGLEVPINKEGAQLLFCKYCGEQRIPLYEARKHIRECWGYPIRDDEPIPEVPIVLKPLLSKEKTKVIIADI